MKAVILAVNPAQLARRKMTGEDRWDEMWDGTNAWWTGCSCSLCLSTKELLAGSW